MSFLLLGSPPPHKKKKEEKGTTAKPGERPWYNVVQEPFIAPSHINSERKRVT